MLLLVRFVQLQLARLPALLVLLVPLLLVLVLVRFWGSGLRQRGGG